MATTHANNGLQARRLALYASLIGIALMLFTITTQRAFHWSDAARMALYEVNHRPNSARANYEMGRIFAVAFDIERKEEQFDLAMQYLKRADEIKPDEIGPKIAMLTITFFKGNYPSEALLQELNRATENVRNLNLQTPYFTTLVKCQQAKKCSLKPQDMLAIFGSALKNPHGNHEARSNMLGLLGLYYTSIGDYRAGAEALSDAVKLNPSNPNIHLNLSMLHYLNGDKAAALKFLESGKKADKYGLYLTRIVEVSALLEKN
ncbi:MAG: tetratricopeptide repeat protein [Pseudomonadota bacterium]